MEPGKAFSAQMTTASQLEKTGRLVEAATIYQKLFDSDRNNRQVIARLLILYRKLKEYKKELSVLKDALAAYKRRQKSDRDEWIQSHPQAASAGKSMLRQLEKAGGAGAGLAGDPSAAGWLKRKQLVTQRITGKKTKVIKLSRQSTKSVTDTPGLKPKAAASKKPPASQHSQNLAKAKQRQLKEEHQRQLKEDKRQRQKEKQLQLKEKQLQLKEKQRQQKEEKQRQQQDEKQRQEKARAAKETAAQKRKEAAALRKQAAQQPRSLFIILLTYRAALDKIDAAMKQHMAYLAKHYDNGDFLVSGRQTPRSGGVILARAANRQALEKTVSQDPFLKHKLATADIIEFSPSQMAQGLKKWLKPSPAK